MILGATLKLTEISVVRGLQLLLLVILIAAFQWGGILYIALAVSFVNVLGYVGLLIYLKRIVSPHWRENFLYPLMIGVLVSLLVGFVLEPALAFRLPVAVGMETPVFRLFIFGILILFACLILEYPFHRELFRMRLSEVASKFRRSTDTPASE